MIQWIRKNALYCAWVVSLAGLMLSLYIGELLRIEPCNLCWYQRIALFPLALILGMATYNNDVKIVNYALPLVSIGALVALYHALGQKIPFLFNTATCGVDECSRPIFTLFGFITFPFLSLIGFGLIGYLLLVAKRN